MRARRVRKASGPAVRGRAAPGRATDREDRVPAFRQEPAGRRGPRGQGRRRDGAGRDRRRPVPAGRRHHRRRRRGARPRARRPGGRDDQGHLCDGLAGRNVGMRRALALVLAGLALVGCSKGSASTSSHIQLTVLAAASLTDVFPKIGAAFTKSHPGVTFTFSFAGTDQLAAQIQQGAPADVFAGASATYGDQLAAKGSIDPWKPFATDRLVVIVPDSNPAGITSPADLARPGLKLVIGAPSVPIG